MSTAYDADVAVVGVGTMGSMACWQLASRGADVIGFEQFAPGHDRAAAGGETRIFRTAYLEGEQYVPLLLESQRLWRRLEQESGHELLNLNGGLMIGHPDEQLLRNVMTSIRTHDLPHQVLDEQEARRRYPQHRLRPGEVMVLDEQAGFLRPELAVTVAALRAQELGCRLVTHRPVTRIEPDRDGVSVWCGDDRWRVRDLVLAAGAWSHRLLPSYTPVLAPQRLVMTWFAAHRPADFAVERFPIFIRNTGRHDISGWPCLDGATVKVAINYGYDAVADPDRLDRTVDDTLLVEIRSAVSGLLPGLGPEPVRVSAYLDGYTSDRHAALGRPTGQPRVVVACGFSGHGFKMSPAIGAAIADHVLDGGTDLPVEHLSPARFDRAQQDFSLRTVVDDLALAPAST
jgi:sarcosine oxidase